MSDEQPVPETMPFAKYLGYTGGCHDGTESRGRFEPASPLVAPTWGIVRPAVLVTIADVALGSLANLTTHPRLSMTLDLTVHGTVPTDRVLDTMSRLVKSRGAVVVGETWFSDPDDGRVVAISQGTFVVSPRPGDQGRARVRSIVSAPGELQRPLPDDLGITVIEPGVAMVALRPYVAQSAGALQGGVTALLGELAAESFSGGCVVALDVRYLSALRIGPAITSTTGLGADRIRVEVRDAGKEDRLCAVVLAQVDAGRPPCS